VDLDAKEKRCELSDCEVRQLLERTKS